MNKFKIHFLNTIWSDAIILEKDKHYCFIDTASLFYYPMIKEYLDKNKITHIDFILLTHFHSDHYSNIVNLINDYDVDTLYIKKYANNEGSTGAGYESNEEYLAHELTKYNEIMEASKKINRVIMLDDLPAPFIIDFNGVKLNLYNLNNNLLNIYNDDESPYYHQNQFSENGNSIPVFIKYNNHNIFLGSDLVDSETEVKEFQHLARRIITKIYQDFNIDHIDLYKSCHHGGSGTNGLELCKLIKPNYTIITNTDRWLNNWSTIDNLLDANKNAKILKTDHYQYIFDFSRKHIKYKKIKKESLFLTLKKN